MTLTINDQEMTGLAQVTAQLVLDRLAEGLMDEPQDELVRGTVQEIEKALGSARQSQAEMWNRAWDL